MANITAWTPADFPAVITTQQRAKVIVKEVSCSEDPSVSVES